MVEYKLYYFNGRGRGEVIRFIFTLAGQKYQDNRIEQANWPEYKKKAPFGQAPFLEVVDGSKTVTLSQSLAIARYLARKFNLAGKGEEEQAQADMYVDQIRDFQEQFIKASWEKDESKKAELLQKFYNETVPFQLRLFENKISKTKSGCLFDSGLNWADLYLFTTLEIFSDRPEVFNDYPSIKSLGKVIREHPKLAAYLAARPKTNF